MQSIPFTWGCLCLLSNSAASPFVLKLRGNGTAPRELLRHSTSVISSRLLLSSWIMWFDVQVFLSFLSLKGFKSELSCTQSRDDPFALLCPLFQVPIIPVVFSSYNNFYLRKEKQFKSGIPASVFLIALNFVWKKLCAGFLSVDVPRASWRWGFVSLQGPLN